MKKRDFQSLSDEEQRVLLTKTVFLVAHLDLIVELCDELEDNKLVWKLNLKSNGNNFRTQALKMLNEILYKDEVLVNEEGKEIKIESGGIQEQAWNVIKTIKNFNYEAIKSLTEEE